MILNVMSLKLLKLRKESLDQKPKSYQMFHALMIENLSKCNQTFVKTKCNKWCPLKDTLCSRHC